ncbi:MAG: UDPGP type 1 family protein [Clostridia bacterium]|nr:UDPGP type 1 family protein [Clostridia bacterium]
MIEFLTQYKQHDLINHYHSLDDTDKKLFEESLQEVDFKLIQSIYNNEHHVEASEIKPIQSVKLSQDDSYFNNGLKLIQQNKTAVVLMAGGQGTRLGHHGPKGTFDIGLPSHKSLFQIQCERLICLHSLTNTYITWYIMTSHDNHDETVSFFESNNYFHYPIEHIKFFKQDRLPLVFVDGQVALKGPTEVNLAANGNGGVFTSLKNSGILNEMKHNGIQYVYLYGIDNAIAKVCDPTLIGFADETQNDIISKAVEKTDPDERVGLMCYKNGKPGIVEYSELSDQLRYMRDTEGKLLYNCGNILQHVFRLDFLEKCASIDLPYHKAFKKINYFNGHNYVEAKEPNGFKFELFMFDVFNYANDMSVLLVDREKEFTPVKNAEGNDSPNTAREMILNEHHRWLKENNLGFNNDTEVDFKLSYKGENLK